MTDLGTSLERLAGLVQPKDEGLERLRARRRRAQIRRRVGAGVLAVTVAAGGTGTALVVLRNLKTPSRVGVGNHPGPLYPKPPAGYYVLLPNRPIGYEAKGRAILDARTNLPDGTRIGLWFFSSDAESPGSATVTNGRIAIRPINNLCHDVGTRIIGTDLKISLTVVPVEHPLSHYKQLPPILQPPSVQEVLGPHFEHLTGSQITRVGNQIGLQTSHFYELSPETCDGVLEYLGNSSFRQVAPGTSSSQPTGPFPKSPFRWCPDLRDVQPVEMGNFGEAGRVAFAFDRALAAGDTATLRQLADQSVLDLATGWRPSLYRKPEVTQGIPNGYGIPGVLDGCGPEVALRTTGIQIKGGRIYLLVLRAEGWKVWGEVFPPRAR